MLRVLFCLSLVLAAPCYAAPLQLLYGVNKLDVNADGVDDIIVRTRWDVASAHSADQYQIAIAQPASNNLLDAGFYTVDFEGGSGSQFATYEGADCVLTAYTFRLNQHKMLEIQAYRRELGDGFTDARPVTKTTYVLAARADRTLGGVGLTPFYFKKTQETTTQKTYCDVREVMK